jgi:hypothetical protein
MNDSNTPAPATYQIKVLGELDASWTACFGLTVQFDGETTTLTGPVLDQAALRGIACRLWDLNLTLIALQRVEAQKVGHRDSQRRHRDSQSC